MMSINDWNLEIVMRRACLAMTLVALLLVVPAASSSAEVYESLYSDGYTSYISDQVEPEILNGNEVPANEQVSLGVGRNYTSQGSFRIFLPPGTTYIDFDAHTLDRETKVVMRFPHPPVSVGYDSSNEDFTPSFSDIRARDVFSRGNTISFQTRFAALSEGGWLYVKVLDTPLRSVSIMVRVNLGDLVPWYNDSATIWDINGDPWAAETGVAPLQVCDSEHRDVCTETNCSTAGEGYWYNDVEGGAEYCHALPPDCHGEDCQTESQCSSADGGYYWYEDEEGDPKSCHLVPACEWDRTGTGSVVDCTPVNCVTSAQCEDADEGFYWYNDVEGGAEYCHALPPDCHGEDCQTESQCLSADGGYYWYEDEEGDPKSCHLVPACEWDRTGTGSVVDCSPDNCITKDQCENAERGFYWYAGEGDDGERCHAEPERGICSRDNLAGCISEAECTSMGGEWHNYSVPDAIRCEERSSYVPPPQYTPPSTSTSTSSRVNSTNPFIGLFTTRSAPVVVCDAQHLDACDQSGCAGLGDGYWWYDDACRAEPVQTDFSRHLSSAPISPRAGADDGVIAAGEGLSFNIAVPANCRLYAVLSIPNLGAFFISNDEILTADMVPVASGTIPVIADICPLLTGEWEDLKGTWTVYTLAIPAAVGESPAQLGAYLDQGGLYAFGSYNIEVGCQEVQPQVQTQVQTGYTLYDYR